MMWLQQASKVAQPLPIML